MRKLMFIYPMEIIHHVLRSTCFVLLQSCAYLMFVVSYMIMTHTQHKNENCTFRTRCKDMFCAAVNRRLITSKERNGGTMKQKCGRSKGRSEFCSSTDYIIMQVAASINLYRVINSNNCFIKQPTSYYST